MNTAVQDARVRTITGLLELNEKRCGTINEATEKMHELMTAVRETGKGGELTITIKVAPDKNDELALIVAQIVKFKLPERETKKALVYHDPDNLAFTKTDPRQLELLAEQEQERMEKQREREAELNAANVARIGRGTEVATA